MHASSFDSDSILAGASAPLRVPVDAPCSEVPLLPAMSTTTATSGAPLDSTSSASGNPALSPADFQGILGSDCGADTPTQARASRTGISDLFEDDDFAAATDLCDRPQQSPLRSSLQEDSSGSFFSLDMGNHLSSSSQGKVSTEILPAWSIGSEKHAAGECTPCLFWFRGTCRRERDCLYCHFVHPGGRVKRVRPTKRHRSSAAQGKAASSPSCHVNSAASASSPTASASADLLRLGGSFVNATNPGHAASTGTPVSGGMSAYLQPLPPQSPWMSAEFDIQHLSF